MGSVMITEQLRRKMINFLTDVKAPIPTDREIKQLVSMSLAVVEELFDYDERYDCWVCWIDKEQE